MASYIGVSPPEQTGIVERYKYTGNGSTTAFSGADTNAKVLRYTSTNPVLVFLNGVQLVEGTDFTKTSNTVVTFAAAPANNDEIEILTFGSFNLNSPATIRCDLGLNTTDSPTFNGLTTTGNINLGDDDVINVGAGNDLQIYHDASNSYIKDAGTGDLRIESSFLRAVDTSNSHTTATFASSGVVLRHANAGKLTTTSTGATITGALVSDGLTVDTNTLHVDATNNRVGIGDTSPQDTLEINNTSSGVIGGLTISNDHHARAALSFARSSTATARIYITEPAAAHTSKLNFQTSDASGSSPNLVTAMIIDENQNVGIGTTSPGTNLHVIGGIALGTDSVANHSSGSLTGVTKLVFGGDNDANGVVGGRIYSSGNALHIQGGTSGLNLRGANNTVHLDINCTTGNVGICCNLTVAGNLTINGTTTTLNTATLDIEDKTLCIAKGAADAAAANGAGIIVDGASANLTYCNTRDAFGFNKKLAVNGGYQNGGAYCTIDASSGNNSSHTSLRLADTDGRSLVFLAPYSGASACMGTVGTNSGVNILVNSNIVATFDTSQNLCLKNILCFSNSTGGPHCLGATANNLFIGKHALCANNQGAGNIAIGYQAMKANVSGCYNTAVGHQALTANVSDAGSYNTAHGYQALYNNTTGEKNTAIGYQSMYANTTGEYNAAIGTDSLRANTIGQQNVALGHNSLYNNTEGFGQVAAGYKSLFNNTTGNYNVGLGAYGLENNVSGSCNIAIGYEVLKTNTCGDNNVAIGFKAVRSSTTALNTIGIGSCALYALTTGSDNVAIGTNAMKAYTTGRCSIAIGNDAMGNTQGQGTTNIAIGLRAGCSLGSGSNIAIGLDAGAKHSATSNAGSNIFMGNGAAQCITAGLQNVVIGPGVRGGTQTTLGNYNTLVGSGSAVCLTGSWNVIMGNCSAECVTSMSNAIVIGACAGRGVNSGGNHTMPSSTIAIGNNALCQYVDDGTNNWPAVAIGANAMCSAIPIAGMRAVAIGHRAMKLNTTGTNNVAVGEDAMCDNTTGRDNVSIGALSGRGTANKRNKVTIGYAASAAGGSDIAIGYNAGFVNSRNVTASTNAGNNVNIGSNSGNLQHADITICENTFVGASSGRGISGQNAFSLIRNVGIGHDAMCKGGNNVSGVEVQGNVAIGKSALCCVAGSSNVGVGIYSGLNLAQGSNNILLGNSAGMNLGNRHKNIAIGTAALRNLDQHCNIAIGDAALCGASGASGYHNISIGLCSTRAITTGYENIAMGREALRNLTTGFKNTAIGYYSQHLSTIGACNVSYGYRSLYSNTTACYNTAIGWESLFGNTTGIRNTAVGFETLYSNTIGIDNIAIGYNSLKANTTGTCNTALGTCALIANTTGHSNTAVGFRALEDNTSGQSNTAVGFCAMCNNTTGISNTAVGVRASMLNLYGTKNSSFGESALQNNTVGGHNVAIGYQALVANAGGAWNTAIGT